MIQQLQAEGTDSYRSFRTSRELGRLVRDDLALLLSERFAAPHFPPTSKAPSPAPARRRSLPVPSTSLVGREQDIDQIVALLEDPEVRLVTLTGPGGIGKTRLAIAVGERLEDRYPAGAVFVPLASIPEPGLVLPRIAAELDAVVEGAHSSLEVLVEHVGDTPTLLVLDNLEQVVEIGPELDELLARCPGLKILATSRTVLRLRAEHDYPVAPLAVPSIPDTSITELATLPAVELFVDRARAVRHDFALTDENAPAVAEICRRLDGLPLAIELAAARTRLLEPKALLARLGNRLDALGTGPVDLPERQRTLRATVEWSVELLDDAERKMLATLAVFVDGWTIDAATCVAGTSEDRTLDLLDALVGHSLVPVAQGDDGPRFRMLGAVREYAAELLAATPDLADVERRHAEYFAELVDQADRPLRGTGQLEWATRLQTEIGNLRQAVRWFFTHDLAPLPHFFRCLWLFWQLRDHMTEARAWVEELLSRAATLGDHAQAELAFSSAVTAIEVGDDTGAFSAADQITGLRGRIDDPSLASDLHLVMSWILSISGDYDGALQAASDSLDGVQELDESFMLASAVMTLGMLETTMGRYDAARQHLAELDELGGQIRSIAITSSARVQLATIAVDESRLDEARAFLDKALDAEEDAELLTQTVTFGLVAYAQLALAEGSPHEAAVALGAADGLRRRAGLRVWPTARGSEANLRTQVERALDPGEFKDAFAAGSQLTRREAMAMVRRAVRGSTDEAVS
jgi:predicted ATPase